MTRHRRLFLVLLLVLSLVSGPLVFLPSPASAAEFTKDEFSFKMIDNVDGQESNSLAGVERPGLYVSDDNAWYYCHQSPSSSVNITRTKTGFISRDNTTLTDSQLDGSNQPCSLDSPDGGTTIIAAWTYHYSSDSSRLATAITTNSGDSWSIDLDPLGNDTTTELSGRAAEILPLTSDHWVIFYLEYATSSSPRYIHYAETQNAGTSWTHHNLTQEEPGLEPSPSSVWDYHLDASFFDEDSWLFSMVMPGGLNATFTNDGGTTWTSKAVSSVGTGIEASVAHMRSESEFWVADASGALRPWRSTDSGDSWTRITGLEIGSFSAHASMCFDDENWTIVTSSQQAGGGSGDGKLRIKWSDTNGSSSNTVEFESGEIRSFAGDGGGQKVECNVLKEDVVLSLNPQNTGSCPCGNHIATLSNLIPDEPEIADQLALFGSARSVVVDPLTDPDVYVRDIESGADRIFRVQPEPVLEELNGPNVCNNIIDESTVPWYLWFLPLSGVIGTFAELISEPTTFQPAQSEAGMASTRNASLPVAHTCALDPDDFNADVQMAKLARTPTLEFTDRWYPFDKAFFERNSFFTFDKHAVGAASGDQAGRWIMTTDRDKGFPNFFDGLTDVAVDKALTPDGGRLWCATNTTAIQCRNANNGTVVDQDLGHSGIVTVELFDGNYYINDGGILRHYTRDGSTLVEQNSVALAATPGYMKISKDGEYMHAIVAGGGGFETDYTMVDLDTFELLFTTTIVPDAESSSDALHEVEGDSANNYAYLVDSTTLYKVETFNFTFALDPVTGEEVTGNLGEENPETNTAHPDDPDPKALDGDDTTTEQGKIAGLASSLNIPTFAMKLIFASTILFFGGVAGTVFMGAKRGPWIGAGAGFLLGVGFQLYDTWVLVTLVIIAAAVIAREGF